MDSTRLELLKNKDEHAQSAIASQEVREHLAGFIRSKRLGSSTQINSHVSQSRQAFQKLLASSCVSQTPANQFEKPRPGKSEANVGGSQHSSVSQESDDHPLRKTASMPTMHVPYKAQSLSRRRQIDRRTTISPLRKRRSRPKRPLLHSLDSKAAEYSSNPCIIGTKLCMSLSQLSSPPPQSGSPIAPPSGQQTSVLLRDSNLAQNSLVDSPAESSSQTNLEQRQTFAVSNSVISADTVIKGENDEDPPKQKQQQRSKVQKGVRKTLISRASSKSKMAVAATSGGSLDSETPSSKYCTRQLAAAKADPLKTRASQTKAHSASSSSGLLLSSRDREDLRQWSLDEADLSASGSKSSRKSATNRTLACGAFNSLRLATTTDAATLRRSQSPCPSISMGSGGLPGFQTSENRQQFKYPAPSRNEPVAVQTELCQKRPLMRANHLLSSSLSSTSSLLSGQDSIEDSSSQAIDLSSSSEANRQRNQMTSSSSLFVRSSSSTNSGTTTTNTNNNDNNNSVFANPVREAAQLNRLNYQKTLQDSFNQLQLCQSQEGIKGILLPAHSIEKTAMEGQASQKVHQHPMLSPIDKTALSLDIPFGLSKSQDHSEQQGRFLAPLEDQFNLSENSHSLISMHDQQQRPRQTQEQIGTTIIQQQQRQQQRQQQQLQFGTLIAQRQRQQDLNDILLAYNNLTQSGEIQGANQINSSLLSRISSLPEPYKSVLFGQLIQQQHQQSRLSSSISLADSGQYRSDVAFSEAGQLHADSDQRSSSIDRALSSTILTASNASNSKMSPGTDVEMPMQAVEFELNDGTKREQLDNGEKIGQLGRSQQPDDPNIVIDDCDSQSGQEGRADCFTSSKIGKSPDVSLLVVAEQNQQRSVAADQSSLDLSLSSASGSSEYALASAATTVAASTSTTTYTSTSTPTSTSFPTSISILIITSIPTLISTSTMTATTASTSGLSGASDASGGHGGIVHQQQVHQLPNALAPLARIRPLDANTVDMLCFNYHDLSKQLRNYSNLLYQPLFNPSSSTGLVYELELCNHKCICNNEYNHPENSFRVLAIWRRLHDCGLMSKCARIEARRASLNELQLCHSKTYCNYFGRSPYERIKLRHLDLSKLPISGLTQLDCGGQGADIDTAWNEEQTPGVARLAVGCVIEAAVQVAKGHLLNAFAIVRPPGHHAEFQQAMGFCFFNSIAIATRVLLTRHQIMRVLIVDWDVHHGNGIQRIFYEDKSVMYISLHRHDKGYFFPGTGGIEEIGSGLGEGFNWNIAWSGETMGDAEYLAAFRSLVMPIARDFNPSMVLVACGFDAARGHPFNFGGYELSPACFAHMTRQLMSLADGRLVLCLEGGYQLLAVCDCAESCVRALLKEDNNVVVGERQVAHQVQESELRRQPKQSAREVLLQLSSVAANYWPSVRLWRHTIELPASDVSNELV